MSLPKTRKQGRFFWERNLDFKIGKIILLLFFAMAISFLFMVFPSFSSERTFQINLQADYISWSEDLSIVIGKGKVSLEYKDVQIEAEEKQESKYAIEYLNKMILPKVDDNVEVSVGTDYHLKLFYKAKSYKITFILAPRVENSD